MAIAHQIKDILADLNILPRRLSLRTPGVQATVPMLRGVFGAALHDLEPEAYAEVFIGLGPPSERTPAYVLRPADPDPEDAPAVEWILIGPAARHDASLLRAWDVASGMGLGPKRSRFHIRFVRPLGPDKTILPNDPATPWPLSKAEIETRQGPCRIRFDVPLRLIRSKRLINAPTFADLVVAACRRIQAYLSGQPAQEIAALTPALTEIARRIPSTPWQGNRLDLQRYSGQQKAEIELRGVAGHLDLPEGPGGLWPLLSAAQWLHLGKGTVFGMGQPRVLPLP